MNIIERVKGILFNPKEEWNKIATENSSVNVLLMNYLIPLAAIPAIASLVGRGMIGYGHLSSLTFGIKYAIISLLTSIGTAFLSAFVIDLLAPGFGAVKNFTKAFALVVFASIPQYVAGVFYIFPALGFIAFLAGLYGLYILYHGLKPMMQTPSEKITGYFVVSLLVIIVITVVLSSVLTTVFIGGMIRAATGF